MHQVRLLADSSVPLGTSPPKSASCTPSPLQPKSITCNLPAELFTPDQTIPLPPPSFSPLEGQQPGASTSAAPSHASTSTSSYSMPILCTANPSSLVPVSGSSSSLQAGPSASSSNGLLPFLGLYYYLFSLCVVF